MKKRRWKSYGNRGLTSSTGERFTYHGDGQGNFLFFRFKRPFSWGAVACTRDEAKRLVRQLNNCTGRDLEKRGRELTETFIAEHRREPLRKAGPNRCFVCFDDGRGECLCHSGSGVCNLVCNEPKQGGL